MTNRFSVVISLVIVTSFLVQPAWGLTDPSKFVRTANYYLKAGTSITPADFPTLASYDLLVLPMEAQNYNRDFFEYARAKNPDIIILPYVPCRSININDLNDGAQIRKRLKDGIRDEWYLRDSQGTIVQAWPGTLPINVDTDWNSYLPMFVKNTILSTGLWDGVFYDEVQDDMTYISRRGDIDLNRDGAPDSQAEANGTWQNGMLKLFQNSRAVFGSDTIVVTNGSSLPQYQPYVNGRMFENFPAVQEPSFLWQKIAGSYLNLWSIVAKPAIFIINANTRNSGNRTDYHRMRYGLATALLSDGYFSFDYGDKDHGQLWKYDEFDVALGKPSGEPKNVFASSVTSTFLPSVWKRDYQRGVVFLNSTDKPQHVDFDEEYEKIHGTQDRSVNDGSIVSSIDLRSKDGIVLYRPLSSLDRIPFKNGTFTRVFTDKGNTKRTGFFSYLPQYRGGTTVFMKDLDRDGRQETILSDKTTVTVQEDSGSVRLSLKPYGQTWKGGFNFATEDLNNDGVDELLVAPEVSLSAGFPKNEKIFLAQTTTIKAYDGKTGALRLGFSPFGPKYRGSVSIAAGPLDQAGKKSIVVGAGAGTAPEVKIFDPKGKETKGGIFAYDKKFKGGVNVAVGNFDGTGVKKIITAPGASGKPQIRIFDSRGKLLSGGFYAFDEKNRSGVRIAAVDIDGDGKDEIIPMTMNVFTLSASRQ